MAHCLPCLSEETTPDSLYSPPYHVGEKCSPLIPLSATYNHKHFRNKRLQQPFICLYLFICVNIMPNIRSKLLSNEDAACQKFSVFNFFKCCQISCIKPSFLQFLNFLQINATSQMVVDTNFPCNLMQSNTIALQQKYCRTIALCICLLFHVTAEDKCAGENPAKSTLLLLNVNKVQRQVEAFHFLGSAPVCLRE